MSANSFNVVIIGAGVAGLTLASRLRNSAPPSFRIAVVDAGMLPQSYDPDAVALRVSAISPKSAHVFRECGVWTDIVDRRAAPFKAMCVWDAHSRWDSGDAVNFRSDELETEVLGYIVENDLIRCTLAGQLAQMQVALNTGTHVNGLEFGARAVQVLLADGERLSAELVVGADGAQSLVRQLAGIRATQWDYQQRAFVTHVKSAKTHLDTAWQRFTDAGPVALLPLADGRSSIVYSTDPGEARQLVDLDEAAVGRRLTAVSDGVLGNLQVAAARASFPLAAAYASDYATERCVLIGDAAHRVHPLAGQGVNLGVADAHELAETIIAARAKGQDQGDLSVLRRYERARKASNELTLHSLDALHRLFSNQAMSVAELRRAGLWIFDRAAPLKRRAARHAMGL